MSLHEHEAWLEEQERRVFVANNHIVGRFSKTYGIPLDDCSTPASAIQQARWFALILLEEEGANYSGLPQRFIKLAAEANGFDIDAKAAYRGHELVVLGGISNFRTSNSEEERMLISIESDNRRGSLQLSRSLWDIPTGRLVVERPKSGYPDHRLVAHVSSIGLIKTASHLVVELPPCTRWQATPAAKDDDVWDWNRATRIALKHSFSLSQVAEMRTFITRLTKGLPYGLTIFRNDVFLFKPKD